MDKLYYIGVTPGEILVFAIVLICYLILKDKET